MDATTFYALAEPNRLKIVELLKGSPLSVNDVAKKLKLRQPQASKHLHTLNQAGLVKVLPVAQKRIYSLEAEPFQQLDDWLSSFDESWSRKFDNLEQYLSKEAL